MQLNDLKKTNDQLRDENETLCEENQVLKGLGFSVFCFDSIASSELVARLETTIVKHEGSNAKLEKFRKRRTRKKWHAFQAMTGSQRGEGQQKYALW